MSPRRVMVVGIGKRVRDVALPAFARAASCFEIADVRARSTRPAEAGVPAVRALDDLAPADVAAVDLVYVAVSKGAVPTVLGRLARFDRSALDLLIETPVLVTKHFRHARLLQGFRSVSVAEDCAFLPWYDVVRRAADGPFGAVRAVRFDQAAWKYHGLAMLKTLLGDETIRRARRIGRVDAGRREVEFEGGGSGVVVEPRDYASGSFTIGFERGRLGDAETGASRLEVLAEGGRARGFRGGDLTSELDDDERALLMASAPPRVTAAMEDWKRVGFLRLLRRLAASEGAYPLARGVDDMLVDDLLDRVGRVSSLGLRLVKRLTGLPR